VLIKYQETAAEVGSLLKVLEKRLMVILNHHPQ
jgi:hypothetical protein